MIYGLNNKAIALCTQRIHLLSRALTFITVDRAVLVVRFMNNFVVLLFFYRFIGLELKVELKRLQTI